MTSTTCTTLPAFTLSPACTISEYKAKSAIEVLNEAREDFLRWNGDRDNPSRVPAYYRLRGALSVALVTGLITSEQYREISDRSHAMYWNA